MLHHKIKPQKVCFVECVCLETILIKYFMRNQVCENQIPELGVEKFLQVFGLTS